MSELSPIEGGEAFVVALLIAFAAAYALGAARLAARRMRPAGARRHDGIVFAAGLVVLAATLLGPLDAWSEQSFAVHMVQHELLMLAAAPLLVRGRPLGRFAWALPARGRVHWRTLLRRSHAQGPWALITGVAGACALQTAALWAWHLPAWFRAALQHPGLHILQHATFLAAALCFWWSVLRPATPRTAASRGIATLFITTLTTGALGALLTFGSSPWYAFPGQAAPFGLTALEDQQLGGLIMWVPGGMVYVVVALLLGARALGTPRPASGRGIDQAGQRTAAPSQRLRCHTTRVDASASAAAWRATAVRPIGKP
ncbi:MAG TPA: cytochrome c oxidase assembly protein [Casimicrobiaceae bacterium]|nr:cytochrome c oxidase assembly protein [Casimicrobiaceae bacterium]